MLYFLNCSFVSSVSLFYYIFLFCQYMLTSSKSEINTGHIPCFEPYSSIVWFFTNSLHYKKHITESNGGYVLSCFCQAVFSQLLLVLVTGLEPVRYCYRGILSPLRLPIPPHQPADIIVS